MDVSRTETIFKSLEHYPQLTKEGIRQCLVGSGSDGAAVMTEWISGVTALLKKKQPCLCTIHCMAHQLELSFKDFLQSFTFTQFFVVSLVAI